MKHKARNMNIMRDSSGRLLAGQRNILMSRTRTHITGERRKAISLPCKLRLEVNLNCFSLMHQSYRQTSMHVCMGGDTPQKNDSTGKRDLFSHADSGMTRLRVHPSPLEIAERSTTNRYFGLTTSARVFLEHAVVYQ